MICGFYYLILSRAAYPVPAADLKDESAAPDVKIKYRKPLVFSVLFVTIFYLAG
jgi:hypothetical protein